MVSRMGMSEQASSTVLDWLHWKSLEVSMKAKIPPTGRERDRQVSQEEKGCFSEITFNTSNTCVSQIGPHSHDKGGRSTQPSQLTNYLFKKKVNLG